MARIRTLMIATAFCVAGLIPFSAEASDQILVVVKTFAGEGRESELQERSIEQIEFFRKVEPTATFRLYRSAQAPTTFLWHEIFESQAAYDNHLKVIVPNYRREAAPALPGLMTKPLETESYVELAK
jgi:quinol monooxygenase YgiN